MQITLIFQIEESLVLTESKLEQKNAENDSLQDSLQQATTREAKDERRRGGGGEEREGGKEEGEEGGEEGGGVTMVSAFLDACGLSLPSQALTAPTHKSLSMRSN